MIQTHLSKSTRLSSSEFNGYFLKALAETLIPPSKIADDDQLLAYVRRVFGVMIPNVQVCANHTTPARAFCDAYFARAPVVIWKASRGFGGKSFLLAALGVTEAVTLSANVNILGGSGAQSRNVHEHMRRFWNHPEAPRHLLTRPPAKWWTEFVAGNSIVALTASEGAVRGPHPQRLRCDEIDVMPIEILDAALGQPMSSPGVPAQTVLSSTHQNVGGTMDEILRRAENKGWPVYEWCWRETSAGGAGWLSQEEIESKRRQVTAEMWRVEYDLQSPKVGASAIMPESVLLMFDRALGEYRVEPGSLLIVEPYQAGVEYAVGADWARKQDWTEIVVLRMDQEPARVVAYIRMQRLEWPYMVGRFEEIVSMYHARAAHDGTGLGDVVTGYMRSGADAVILSGRARAEIFAEYISAIESGRIRAPYIDALFDQHYYVSVDDVFGAGHPPDGFVAGALAWYAGARRGVLVG